MKKEMTVLELYCEFKEWQGGTLHQVMSDFKDLTLEDKDRFCGDLLTNSNDITDYKNMNWFFHNRNGHLTLSERDQILII